MPTVQAPVPVQAPVQPVKVELASGVAVSVTSVPESNGCAQSAPQLMPTPLTVPVPVPALLTVRLNVRNANDAVTLCACVMVKVQEAVPEHAPVQPVNV